MKPASDRELIEILAGVFGLLIVVTGIAWLIRARASEAGRASAENLWARTRSFWLIALLGSIALLTGEPGAIVLFFLISLLALREFMTLAPTRASDHRAMAWTFFVIAPLQYVMVATHWYGFYSILIPVYAFLFIPALNAMAGDPQRFLERTATVQWGLMVCVYCLSFAPALLWLRIPGYEGESAKLLLFCIVVAQLSDFLQYVFGKLFGRRKIAPVISPNKTWEGFVGGVLGATLVGTALWWATPFRPLVAAAMALTICLMGFAGGLAMSAIKRDRGVKDFGALIAGHGGILDRVDSICFSVPVFFHLTRFFFARGT
jgi:phosphatidate cytidylyltransferase